MSRRTVKTIETDIDLSSVLKLPEDLPTHWNPRLLFGRSAPLELEIGSGKGLFISHAVVQTPAHDFIGIEIGKKYARLCADKLRRLQCTNGIMIGGDAAQVLQERIPEETLFAVHVYFPDPWWKRAHRKRRILRTEVLKLIESRLIIGGIFHFWTDVEEYFHTTLGLLKKNTALQGPFDVPEQRAENDLDYRTHFERRTRLHGEQVYRTEFRK